MTTPLSTNPLSEISELGVSVWLDDLSRERLDTGNLKDLIATRDVVGVTTNPTIFAGALSKGEAYDAQVHELATAGVSPTDAIFSITTDDVRNACDVFASVTAATDGEDGRVSIEVEPGLAHDREKTVEQALQLWKTVDRPNAMIKIPATVEGLGAIEDVLAQGVSVNVTLIFGLDRYRQVIDAYMAGLQRAKDAGINLAAIRSVASFFVSRFDTEVDKRLAKIDSPEAAALHGKTAIANARLAYQEFLRSIDTPQWKALAAAGARVQRPLWASTGAKDPSLPDTVYVDSLVAASVVNTMPEKTLEATFDHGTATTDTISGTFEESQKIIDTLTTLGIDYHDVTTVLEAEGVEKFIVSWNELVDTVTTALADAR